MSFPYDRFPETLAIVEDESKVFAIDNPPYHYLVNAMYKDLSMRFTPAQCDTCQWHMHAKWSLLQRTSQEDTMVAEEVGAWNYVPTRPITEPT